MPTLTPLPIDPLLPEVVAALDAEPALVLEAPPGAGKTTRVPAALLDAAFARGGELIVLQPRRLPTRLAAERVAGERGERVGEAVGYSVRYEDVGGPRTRLRFVTEGVLQRRLLADPSLRGVAGVVLDEFHERHLASDLSLALLRRLQETSRPDLRLVVMSATLDAEPVSEFLGHCRRLRSEGRMFDVAVSYAADADDRPVSDQVAAAVRRLVQEGTPLDGDVLVFLPGAAEIRRTADALAGLAESRGWLVLPLHGELPLDEQNRAVRPADRRKIILSTNVAETSVTIDGVTTVIDAGLARIASLSPWTGLPTLRIGKISQASAIQRAGRAGRTRPGRALRLFTRHDFETRRGFDAPEVERLDLAEPLLVLAALGVRDPGAWPWFERPPGPALAAARELCRRLGAVDAHGALTEIGQQMLRFPVHPRLGRMLVEGERRGVGEAAATVAALLGERDVRERSRVSFGGGRGPAPPESADLFELVDAFEQARRARFDRGTLRSLGLDARATEAAERARRQLAQKVDRRGPAPRDAQAVEEALALAVLSGLPDRVGKRRRAGGDEIVLAGGGAAAIGPVPPAELVVAVDAEERHTAAGRSAGTLVRLAVAIPPEALLEIAPDAVSDIDELVWNPQTERVDRRTAMTYGAVVLEETRRPAEPSPEAARLLLAAARSAGAAAFVREGSADALSVQLRLLGEAFPDLGIPAAGGAADFEGWLAATCEGRTSFKELREAALASDGRGRLPPAVQDLLRRETPAQVRLPGGREVPVHYEADRPPWIESRLQDFFGMAQGPSICRGRVPLTLHLLAPNGRAVQVTRDLANFWKQHYPPLRRELGRRYPRHFWPEDGATAAPPAPRPPRR